MDVLFTGTPVGIRTKKGLAGGTDGFLSREAQRIQAPPASHMTQTGKEVVGN